MHQERSPRHQYPAAMVNITNRCTLRCCHCFVYRDGNPNRAADEMGTPEMIAELTRLRDQHGIMAMLWMGGEPLLRPDVLEAGVPLFSWNHVTTNGTLDLIELPGAHYVVSLDGPRDYNDSVRGKGSFDRVMRTLSRVPRKFASKVMVQCVVTAKNQDLMEDLVKILVPTRAEGMTFSFYVPPRNDVSGLSFGTLENRDTAVRNALALKKKYPGFIWNGTRQLTLTLSENALAVTRDCPSKKHVLPLYLTEKGFTHPFCCYGDDVCCDLCGAWVVFYLAEKMEKAGAK
ncbi:MAG: radical SAM protein [Thermodesulfobacteriota bacterium]